MTTDLVLASKPNTFDLLPNGILLASKIAGTDFVPRALRGKPEAVLACILTGHELGIGPMQSLAKIHVIEGRPAMSSELMRAIILGAGHDLWVEESTNTRCVLGARRTGSMRDVSVVFTLDDAKAAGLIGKDVWRKYPRAMLLARATAELARSTFPDLLAGISYTTEELTDGDVVEPDELTPAAAPAPAKPAARKAKARAAATAPRTPAPAAVRPLLPGEDEPDEAPADAGPRVTGPALIAIRLDEHGIRDRGDRLAFAGAALGRVVDTTKTLTPAEVTTVLETIADDARRAAAIEHAGLPAEAELDDEDDGEDPDAQGPYTDDDEDPAPLADAPTDTAAWRELLKANGVRVVDALRYAAVASLDELTDEQRADLYAWTLRGGQ